MQPVAYFRLFGCIIPRPLKVGHNIQGGGGQASNIVSLLVLHKMMKRLLFLFFLHVLGAAQPLTCLEQSFVVAQRVYQGVVRYSEALATARVLQIPFAVEGSNLTSVWQWAPTGVRPGLACFLVPLLK
jgi:hypothetical protein